MKLFRFISYRRLFSTGSLAQNLASSNFEIISNRYQEAISTLNGLQTNQSSLKSTDERGKSLNNIVRYLSLLNVQLDDIDKLNVVHVAGTKGKGSTCAFTESILRQYGYRTGFFSSPHLIEARERIRIDGEMLSKEKFVDYFWKCYNGLRDGIKQSESLPMPFYFSFMTTMMFYVFIHEKIDVAIVEVGIGGEFDCTNIIKTPIVCGITSLGLDHVQILGNTIEQIAWQKAGIFKKNVPAITVPQVPEAMRVLQERAEEKQCPLSIAPLLNQYPNYPFRLSLAGDIQESNASLAIQLAFHWLNARGQPIGDSLSTEILRGLATCRWLGRNQIIDKENATYFLDGAHTVESIEQCKNWFRTTISKFEKPTRNILLFYCSSDRNPDSLLRPLMECTFDRVAFCSPVASLPPKTDNKSDNDQWRATTNVNAETGRLSLHVAAFEKLWSETTSNGQPMPSLHCFHTASQALAWVDDSKSSKPCILVTGSLYLVGAVLKLLGSSTSNSDS